MNDEQLLRYSRHILLPEIGVEGLFKSGPLKGLILDLRNDPGGLLNGAVAISAAFLPRGVAVVSTDGRTEDAKRKFIAALTVY